MWKLYFYLLNKTCQIHIIVLHPCLEGIFNHVLGSLCLRWTANSTQMKRKRGESDGYQNAIKEANQEHSGSVWLTSKPLGHNNFEVQS